jgi:ActR/RegA family two-component response regulator
MNTNRWVIHHENRSLHEDMEETIMSAVKILLVDDEKPFVETMMKRLKKREIDVKPAYDGQEALNYLEKIAASKWSFWTLKCRTWME